MSDSLLNVSPTIQESLDPGFIPAILAVRRYGEALAASGSAEHLVVAGERESGCIWRSDFAVLPRGGSGDEATLRLVERHIKFLLWARGAWRLYLSGRRDLCEQINRMYAPGGAREFDVELMARAYDKTMEVNIVELADMPAPAESSSAIGGHLDGCRIGFDLGASDYKLAAVVDGEPVFSTEIPWDPSAQPDPAYHYERISAGLKEAASHMPRVDAIGGSSAGILVDNQVKVASLFRSVPAGEFAAKVKPLFLRLQEEWQVPMVVVNDGDVIHFRFNV